MSSHNCLSYYDDDDSDCDDDDDDGGGNRRGGYYLHIDDSRDMYQDLSFDLMACLLMKLNLVEEHHHYYYY